MPRETAITYRMSDEGSVVNLTYGPHVNARRFHDKRNLYTASYFFIFLFAALWFWDDLGNTRSVIAMSLASALAWPLGILTSHGVGCILRWRSSQVTLSAKGLSIGWKQYRLADIKKFYVYEPSFSDLRDPKSRDNSWRVVARFGSRELLVLRGLTRLRAEEACNFLNREMTAYRNA